MHLPGSVKNRVGFAFREDRGRPYQGQSLRHKLFNKASKYEVRARPILQKVRSMDWAIPERPSCRVKTLLIGTFYAMKGSPGGR